jgi:hypothetical protein
VTVTTTTPGQNSKLTFNGTAGQRVSLTASNITIPGCPGSRISILKPDGTELTGANPCGSTLFLDVQTLPVNGTYTILVNPNSSATGQATLTLYDVPADFTGTITPGGSSVTVTTTTPGQNAKLTFNGTAGQRVSLIASNITIPGCPGSRISILKPDGTELTGANPCGSTLFLDVQTLPVNGTYTILVDANGAATGQATITLYDVPADVTGPIVPNGDPVTVTITTPGQNANLTFSGAAGQQVSVLASGITFPGCPSSRISILKPDGTELAGTNPCGSSLSLGNQTLPVAGTYTIRVNPNGANTGSATLTLTSP